MPAALLPAADAGHHRVGQASQQAPRLLDGFAADHRLKVAHDLRKGVRADGRAENVMRGLNRAHPVAHGFIHRVAQVSASRW